MESKVDYSDLAIKHPELSLALLREEGVQYLYRPVLYSDIPSITPNENNLRETIAWWKEQLKRCKYGWIAPDGHYINPITYWYLNFCKASNILNFKTKKFQADVSPLYTKFHDDMISSIWDTHPNNKYRVGDIKDVFVAKGRRIVFSGTMRVIIAYNMLFYKDYVAAIIYPDQLLHKKERILLKRFIDSVHPFFYGEFIDESNFSIQTLSDNEEIYQIGKRENNKDIIGAVCAIQVADINTKKLLRGWAIIDVLIEEAGAMSNLIVILGSVEKTTQQGACKIGRITTGGTSDKITNKSRDYEKMYKSAKGDKDKWLCLTIFSHNFDLSFTDYKTGITDEKKAFEHYTKELERVKKIGDAKKTRMFRQETPLCESDLFLTESVSGLNSERLDAQEANILKNELEKNYIRGDFEYETFYNSKKKTGKILFNEHNEGKTLIHYEFYKNFGKYRHISIASIDGVYLNKSTQEEAEKMESKFAMVLGTINHNYDDIPKDTPVLIYEDRKANISDDIKQITMALKTFNPMFVGLEKNEEMIKELLQKESINIEEYTVKENEINKMTMLFEELVDGNELVNIEMIDIIKSLKIWRIKNTDIGSAFGLYLLMKDRHKDKFSKRLNAGAEHGNIDIKGKFNIIDNKNGWFSKVIIN